jgi:hypothetical protein
VPSHGWNREGQTQAVLLGLSAFQAKGILVNAVERAVQVVGGVAGKMQPKVQSAEQARVLLELCRELRRISPGDAQVIAGAEQQGLQQPERDLAVHTDTSRRPASPPRWRGAIVAAQGVVHSIVTSRAESDIPCDQVLQPEFMP